MIVNKGFSFWNNKIMLERKYSIRSKRGLNYHCYCSINIIVMFEVEMREKSQKNLSTCIYQLVQKRHCVWKKRPNKVETGAKLSLLLFNEHCLYIQYLTWNWKRLTRKINNFDVIVKISLKKRKMYEKEDEINEDWDECVVKRGNNKKKLWYKQVTESGREDA